MLSLLPGLEQHGAKHDQGNDQDDDNFAKAKHDLADLRPVRYGVGTRRWSSSNQGRKTLPLKMDRLRVSYCLSYKFRELRVTGGCHY